MPEEESFSKNAGQIPEAEAAEVLKPIEQELPDEGEPLSTVTIEQLKNIGFVEDYSEAVEMATRIEDVVQSADQKGMAIDPEKGQQLVGFVRLAIEKQFADEGENREQLVEIGTRFAFLQGKIQYQLETATLIEQQETLSDHGRKRLYRLISRLIAEEYVRSQPKREAGQPTTTVDQASATDIRAPKIEETKAIIEKLGISLVNDEGSGTLPVQRTADEILISKQALDGEFDQNAALEALYSQKAESDDPEDNDDEETVDGEDDEDPEKERPRNDQEVISVLEKEGIKLEDLIRFKQYSKQQEMFALASVFANRRENPERLTSDQSSLNQLIIECGVKANEAATHKDQDITISPNIEKMFFAKLAEYRVLWTKIRDAVGKYGIDIKELNLPDDNSLDSGSDQSSEGKGDSDQPIENQRGGAEKEKSGGGPGGRAGDKANLRGFAGFKESLKGFLTTFSSEIEYLNLPAKVLGV